MRIALFSAVSLAALIASTAAQADPAWPNWYLGLRGSVAMLQDGDISGTPSGEVEYDNGYALSVALGYTPAFTLTSYGKGRFEVEYYYQKNDLDSATLGGVTGTIGGDQNTEALMFNAFYDFALQNSRFAPYLGAGIGIANTDVNSSFGGVALTNDDDSALAWQLMAGVGYSPSTLPFTTWSVGYRYFTTEDLKLQTNASTGIELENSSHNIEAGVQFKF